jgi:hypothetical protein
MEGVTPQQILEAPDLIAVGIAGDEVRRRMRGTATTFVRVLETHVDAPLQVLPARLSAGEMRIVGTPSSLEIAVTAVRALKALAGPIPVTGFSLFDLQGLEEPLPEVCRALRSAGLVAVAHLPIDGVTNPRDAVRVVHDEGLQLLTVSIQIIGAEERLSVYERVAELQQIVGGFRAFAPLPRTLSLTQPTTGYDDVKSVALARVMVTNIDSIQVDWQLYGPKMAQVALTVGADDVDNISAVDPGVLGTRRSPLEEIRGNIKAAALEPVERDGLFAAV